MTSDVRAALDAGDDGFHEIQLNGKQLVFLGMATTLVSVVIFLCGVLVGRGVKPLDTVAQAAGPQAFDAPVTSPVAPGAIATPAPAPPATPAAIGAATARGRGRGCREPPATPSRRRSATNPTPPAPAPASDLAAAAAKRRPPPPPSNRRRRRSSRARRAKPKPAPRSGERGAARARRRRRRSRRPPRRAGRDRRPRQAAGGAIAVQVGAFATRKRGRRAGEEAQRQGLRRLRDEPDDDGKNVYRVRVGNYSTADEAQRVSARLTQQEKLKPWVIR